MIIREKQMETLATITVRSFEDRMIEHLRGLFPNHAEALSESGLREVIQLGIERAAGYGLTAERVVCHYIDLMFLLGSGFDKDLQVPWAGEILQASAIPDQFQKIDKLYGRAMEYLDQVAGPKNEHIKQVLQRLHTEAGRPFLPPDPKDFASDLTARLAQLYPQKHQAVGEERLRQLVRSGEAEAQAGGFQSPEARALYIGLMFALGSGFASDPQFPWAQAARDAPAGMAERQRVEMLLEAARRYMQRWLA